MKPLLELHNLEITFGRGADASRAVTGLNLSVFPGEIVSLVGESGCGKSVTALSIPGLLPRQGRVSGGEILFEGQNLAALSGDSLDAVRGPGVAMVFQDILNSLNPVLPLGLQMTEGMRRHLGLSRREARDRAVALLDRVGLPDAPSLLHQYPHMLSGGMRQRAMIAMALSCGPKLLIADEPTTALDVTLQFQITRLIRSLRDETGMAVLLITHDIGVVAETADRVAVMYAGQVVESAQTDVLLRAPRHPYTRALMRAVPRVSGDRDRTLYAIPGTVPERYDALEGCRFAPRCACAGRCAIGPKEAPELRQAAPGHQVRCPLRWEGED